MDQNLRQLLRSHAIFKGIGETEFEDLVERLMRERLRSFDARETIFAAGDQGDFCYVVLDGTVDIVVDGQAVGRCRRGQLLGELGLIGEQEVRGADAVAQESTLLVELSRQQFGQLLAENPIFAGNLLQLLSDKLRWTTGDAARAKAGKDRYAHILKRHVSPQTLDYLMRRQLGMDVPHMLPHAIVLFADVQGFTRLTCDMTDPGQLAEQLSRYFHRMTTLVHDHGGAVNAFLGDGLLAYWGFPTLPEDAHEKAIRCALAMHTQGTHFTLGSGPIVNRIGLAAGPVFCGVVGHPPVEQFTILGEAVNRAARLEQGNKKTGTSLLMSRDEFGEALDGLADHLPDGCSAPMEAALAAHGYDDPIECLGLSF